MVLTGSELLEGRLTDRNGRFLCAQLTASGLSVSRMVVLRDDLRAMTTALRELVDRAPRLLVISGGLGTTHDDVTSAAVAAAVGRPLAEDQVALDLVAQRVVDLCRRRGLSFDEVMRQACRQALLPLGSHVVAPAGAAPGYTFTVKQTTIVVLPGVPLELEAMWPAAFAQIAHELETAPRRRTLLRIYGVGELQVSAIVDAVPRQEVEASITAAGGEVAVAIAARVGSGVAAKEAAQLESDLRRELPVFSSDGRTVEEIVAALLRQRGETVAVGESCTGGLLGARLTSLSGSSAYFVGGVIAYSNEAKMRLLAVPAEVLKGCGAVSAQTAEAMAKGARQSTGATYGLSTTGIAGPGGGTSDKPVGLVYVGCAGPRTTGSLRQELFGSREAVRTATVTAALHLLREALLE